MALGNILMTVVGGARISFRDRLGSPARLYSSQGVLITDMGEIVAPTSGEIDVWADDRSTYTVQENLVNGVGRTWNAVEAASPGEVVDRPGFVRTVGANRTLTAADNGCVLECTTTVTLTVPVGLPKGFRCEILPNGTTSIARSGDALINGAGTTLTRAAATAANAVVSIVSRASAPDSYVVTGS